MFYVLMFYDMIFKVIILIDSSGYYCTACWKAGMETKENVFFSFHCHGMKSTEVRSYPLGWRVPRMIDKISLIRENKESTSPTKEIAFFLTSSLHQMVVNYSNPSIFSLARYQPRPNGLDRTMLARHKHSSLFSVNRQALRKSDGVGW